MTQPPPPPPPSDWVPSTGGSFSVGSAISYGWTAYWRNVGPMVLLTVVIFAVDLLISVLGSASNSLASQIVFQILSFVVGIILTMGLIRASLAITEGRKPSVSMLIDTNGFAPYLGALILAVLGVALGTLALIVPGIMLLVAWHLFGYVIVENPQTSPTTALRRSAEVTKGHRWQLLGLIALLALINFIGALALGIGLLFTYGISTVTFAYSYKTLSGQPIAPT